jgi:hypothetical protein
MLALVGRNILHPIRVSLKKKKILPEHLGSLQVLLYLLSFVTMELVPRHYWCTDVARGGDPGVGGCHSCGGCSCRGGKYYGGICPGGHGGVGEHCGLG